MTINNLRGFVHIDNITPEIEGVLREIDELEDMPLSVVFIYGTENPVIEQADITFLGDIQSLEIAGTALRVLLRARGGRLDQVLYPHFSGCRA